MQECGVRASVVAYVSEREGTGLEIVYPRGCLVSDPAICRAYQSLYTFIHARTHLDLHTLMQSHAPSYQSTL